MQRASFEAVLVYTDNGSEL